MAKFEVNAYLRDEAHYKRALMSVFNALYSVPEGLLAGRLKALPTRPIILFVGGHSCLKSASRRQGLKA